MKGKFFIYLCATFAFWFFLAPEVLGCQCEVSEPARVFEDAGAVFIGTVAEAETVFNSNASFKVEQSWKPIDANRLTVYNVKGCEVLFQEGFRYLVYAREKGGRLTTSRCERTIRLLNEADGAEDLKFLSGRTIHIVPETELLSFENLKIALFLLSLAAAFLLAWFLLAKFGYV